MSVRNTRGTEKGRFPMICTNPGLDRWEAMVKIGDHSDLKPWEDGYADVKKQLGEWHIVVEGWEDTYASWLHDAQIKVEVGDDVENALESGAQLLERWAGARDSKLTADDKKDAARRPRRPLPTSRSTRPRVLPRRPPTQSQACTKPIRCATA